MGFWSTVLGLPPRATAPVPTVLATPGSGESLADAIIGDLFGALPADLVTVDTARRVPELKRALAAHQALVAPLRFEKYTGGQLAASQPFWVSGCTYPDVSRYLAVKQLVGELFWHGVAALGCWLDTDGQVYDWVTLRRDMWTIDSATGALQLQDESLPPQFRQRVALVSTGESGVMVDGIDAIRVARLLDAARRTRMAAPPAAVEIHITDAQMDGTPKERAKLAKEYAENRTKHSVSVTPSYVEIKEKGTGGTLDLFETATTSVSRSLAMHAGVPAGFVESGPAGATGQMRYQNANGELSDLWTFGSAAYAYAIAAALSSDDFVGPGSEVRIDTSAFATPAPAVLDPEAGDTTTGDPA